MSNDDLKSCFSQLSGDDIKNIAKHDKNVAKHDHYNHIPSISLRSNPMREASCMSDKGGASEPPDFIATFYSRSSNILIIDLLKVY